MSQLCHVSQPLRGSRSLLGLLQLLLKGNEVDEVAARLGHLGGEEVDQRVEQARPQPVVAARNSTSPSSTLLYHIIIT